jgi:hypothetical protein
MKKIIATFALLLTTTFNGYSQPWILDLLDRSFISLSAQTSSQPTYQQRPIYVQPVYNVQPYHPAAVRVINRGGILYVQQPAGYYIPQHRCR